MGTSVKIDFVIPGFSKCGTTTLCALLDLHPDIYIPNFRELWYFSHEKIDTQHKHYDGHYAPAKPGQLKGDGSTDYTGYLREHAAAARIHENNPDCRFIFIARNPKARVESSYREMHHSGVKFGLNAPFALSDCLRSFPQLVQDTLYWRRINTYRDVFGDEAILVVFLEDLKSSRDLILRQCFDHLGLDMQRFPNADAVQLNTGEEKLYDARLFRSLRTNRFTGPTLAKLTGEQQDRVFGPLRLRRPFGKRPMHWDEYSLDIFRREIAPDSLCFLDFYGKPASYWGLDKIAKTLSCERTS